MTDYRRGRGYTSTTIFVLLFSVHFKAKASDESIVVHNCMLKSGKRRKLQGKKKVILLLFVSKGRIFLFSLKQRCSSSQGSITGWVLVKGYMRSSEIQLQLLGVSLGLCIGGSA